MKCRLPAGAWGVTDDTITGEDPKPCPNEAAVGIVFEVDHVDPTTGSTAPQVPNLAFLPLCAEHAPEECDEMIRTMNPDDYAIFTLAYGQVGDLA